MNCTASYSDEMRVQLILVNGRACVELGGRTPEGATPEEIAALFDKLKAGTLGALKMLKCETVKADVLKMEKQTDDR